MGPWEELATLARLAPTPHDTHPFRIRRRGDRAELVLLTERLLPREDRGLVCRRAEVDALLAEHGLALPAHGRSLPLPLLLHWGRQDSAVAFYGCKVTPEDLQNVIFRVEELGASIENYALHPFEDTAADKRLELWLELAAGLPVPDETAALEARVLDELAQVNQDFREARKMIPEHCRPTLKLFPFGQSPISGQDIRIKKRYIV